MDKILDNNLIWILYLFCPFLLVIAFGALKSVKNPIYIRRICKTFFVFEIVLLFFINIFKSSCDFELLNSHFLINNQNMIVLFVVNFVFLLFSFFSKGFVKSAKKIFYCVLVLLYGLLNVFLLMDNIGVSLICLFWMILGQFLISNISFRKNLTKIQTKKQCVFDIVFYLIGVFLIAFDFLRYFILNELSFRYSTISEYMVHIDDRAILIAFVGFLVLIFRQFGFLNLFDEYNRIFAKKTFYITSIVVFVEFVAGLCLFLKVYSAFDYLFYQYQVQIAAFLLINLILHTIFSFRNDNLLKIVHSMFIVNVILGLFSVFLFSKIGTCVSFYYFVVLVVSYLLLLFVFSILEEKFKTKCIDDFKKINDKTRMLQMFVLFSLMNFIKAPVCAYFFSFLFLALSIASIEYDGLFLKSMPYIALICMLFISISGVNLVYKILIEPLEVDYNKHFLLKHQRVCLIVLIGFLYILLFACQNIINESMCNIGIGNF